MQCELLLAGSSMPAGASDHRLEHVGAAMSKLFISHSTQDDEFVRNLRAMLADHRQDVWIDSRELRGGDPLWPEIQKAIDEASAYAVVVNPSALQSDWVSDELEYALKVQERAVRRSSESSPCCSITPS